MTDEQRERRNEKLRERNAYRAANGLCTMCGKPLDREGRRCKKCSEKYIRIENERKQSLLEINICPRCGENELYGNRKMCIECLARARNHADTDEHRAKDAARKRRIRAERREKHLCIFCGKPLEEGCTYRCLECTRKDMMRKARKPKKDVVGERIANNTCPMCGSPLYKDQRLCEKHYKQIVARNAKRDYSVKKLNVSYPIKGYSDIDI